MRLANKSCLAVCALLAASAASAHASIHLRLYVTNGLGPFIGPGPTPKWNMSADPWVVLSNHSVPSDPYTFTLNFPDGSVASTGSQASWTMNYASYPTFADLHTAAEAGPWSLTVTTPGDPAHNINPATSVYSLNILADLTDDLMVQTQPIVPFAGQFLPNHPTFSWPAGLDYRYGYAYVTTPSGAILASSSSPLNPSITSWTPSVTLPNGDYRFRLTLYGPAYNYPLPVTATLLSGPDLGPVSLLSDYSFGSITPFSVPEPAALTLAPVAILAFRRNRRPDY
jgi:hypothetical protein